MSHIERGPDRRRNTAPVVFPLVLPGGERIDQERRRIPDRRKNAFLTQQLLTQGIPAEQIEAVLASAPVRTLGPGDVLLSPGQSNRYLYLLLSGRLQVHLEAANSPLGFPIEPGECIGEMSIIDGKPTSAYVVAEAPSAVCVVPEDLFWDQIAPIPGVARNLLQVLAERMRTRNDVTLKALEQQLRYEHLQKELDVARDLQANMLPKQNPLFPQHPGVDASALMQPAWEVGGDFFDAFVLDSRRVCVAVGDVSGKGIPSALFMVKTLTALRIEMLGSGEIEGVLPRLNTILCENNPSCMFVSLFLAVVDAGTGQMSYASAGHNPPLVFRDGSPAYMERAQGVILGVAPEAAYPVSSLSLAPGETLLMYTDGVTEAQNVGHEFYTATRLLQFCSEQSWSGAAALVSALREDLERFATGAPQFDDITILALRHQGAPQP